MPLYGDILWANFLDLKNSINRQINGNLDLSKVLESIFLGLILPSGMIYLNIS
jgi:hypothetical protein